jgi:hypothetical protein
MKVLANINGKMDERGSAKTLLIVVARFNFSCSLIRNLWH